MLQNTQKVLNNPLGLNRPPCRYRRHSGHCPAFTIVEIMAATAILATATLGVAFALQNVGTHAKLDAAADDLAILLQTLSTQAAVTAHPTVITITPGSAGIEISHITHNADDRRLLHTIPHNVIVESTKTPDQPSTQTPLQLIIQPSGYLADVTFCLRYKQKTILLTWDASTRRAQKKYENEIASKS